MKKETNSLPCRFTRVDRKPEQARSSQYHNSTSVMENHSPSVGVLTWLNGCCGTIMTIVTLLGQCMVFYVVSHDKRLRTPSNFYISSLATADLLIGLVSMPVWTMYTAIGYWPMSQIWCDIWNVSDFVLCTVSIYTILYISLDRYLCLRNPLGYSMQKTKRKTIRQLGFVWVFTSILCISYIGLTQYFLGKHRVENECQLFFLRNLPLTVAMCTAIHWFGVGGTAFLYMMIYGVVKEVTIKKSSEPVVGKCAYRSEDFSSEVKDTNRMRTTSYIINKEDGLHVNNDDDDPIDLNQSKLSIISNGTVEMELSRLSTPKLGNGKAPQIAEDAVACVDVAGVQVGADTDVVEQDPESKERNEKIIRMKRSFDNYINGASFRKNGTKRSFDPLMEDNDRKALRTIALLLCTFSICWLPLSFIFVIEAAWPNFLSPWFTIGGYWLGYVNSMLNPVCYAIGNPYFRETFKKVVLGSNINIKY